MARWAAMSASLRLGIVVPETQARVAGLDSGCDFDRFKGITRQGSNQLQLAEISDVGVSTTTSHGQAGIRCSIESADVHRPFPLGDAEFALFLEHGLSTTR